MTLGPNGNPDSPRNDFLKTGPPLVGIILNWFLFGILIMQYLTYWSHVAKKDSRILQAIVHLLFLLDTVQTIMIMNDAFNRYVYNFGNYEVMLESFFSGTDSPLMDALIAMVVQFVYCWRIWVLSNRKVLPCIIGFLSFVACGSGIVVGIADTVLNFVHNVELAKWYITVMLWLWTSVATDVLIAGSMIYLLRWRSKGCSQSVKSTAKRLLILTLGTNALTAIVAMFTAIVPLVPRLQLPFTNMLLVGGYLLGKLYSNCFMVLLNQRMYFENPSQGSVELGTLEAGTGLCSEPYNLRTIEGVITTQVSSIQVSDTTIQVDFKRKISAEMELGVLKP